MVELKVIDNAGFKDISGVLRLPIAQMMDPQTKRERTVIGNKEIDRFGLRIHGKEYLSDEQMHGLFSGEVVIEEKVDGHPVIVLCEGYTLFAESLTLKHSIAYDAVPYSIGPWPDHTVVYDILEGELEPPYKVGQGTGHWLTREEKEIVCEMVGAPLVPLLFKGRVNPEDVPSLALRTSSFGAGQAEGVVIKNLKAGIFGKFVNVEFIRHVTDEALQGGKHPMQLGIKNIRRHSALARVVARFAARKAFWGSVSELDTYSFEMKKKWRQFEREPRKNASEDSEIQAHLDAFMQAYFSATMDNPIMRGDRLWGMGDRGLVNTKLRPFEGKIYINTIFSENPKKGAASDVLKMICQLADKYQVQLALYPKPFGTQESPLNKTQLIAWYKRNGFKGGKGCLVREPIFRSHREAGLEDLWLKWVVQPFQVLWKHREEFVQGPVNAALDSILKELAPLLIRRLAQIEVDTDIDEFILGANAAIHGKVFDTEQPVSFQEGQAWGKTHPDEVGNDLSPALKRQLIRDGLHEFQQRITQEVVHHALTKAWEALPTTTVFNAVIGAVKKHGWKGGVAIGLGALLLEMLEHGALPALAFHLTGSSKSLILGTLPISEICWWVASKMLHQVPAAVDKPAAGGHLQWFEREFGPVRLAFLLR